MHGTTPLLTALNLKKTYVKHANRIEVLRGVDLDVAEGEFLSVIGNSGSGKSTMLHLLGTLDQPDDGTIHLEGRNWGTVHATLSGKVKKNVLPWPGSDSAQMRPPWPATIFSQMARPNPIWRSPSSDAQTIPNSEPDSRHSAIMVR